MWTFKGAFLGLLLTAVGTLVFLYFAVFRNLGPNTAVAVSLYASYTTRNPLWWAGLIVAIVVGCMVARKWPGKGWFWSTVVVTLAFPAGVLGLILAAVAKLGHAR